MLWKKRGNIKRWHKGILPLLGPIAAAVGGSAGATAAGAAGGSALLPFLGGAALGGILPGLFGDDEEERPTYNLPDYQKDPYYSKAQETLYPFGENLLSGNIPEYYKPIGEIGGKLFEDVLGLGKRDIMTAGLETGARLGQRGGNLAPGIAGKISEYSQKARFDDYMRALTGRQFLLGAGADITSGVRSGALSRESALNQYEVNKGNLALGYAGLGADIDIAEGSAISSGIGSGISSLANIYALSQLGKVA